MTNDTTNHTTDRDHEWIFAEGRDVWLSLPVMQGYRFLLSICETTDTAEREAAKMQADLNALIVAARTEGQQAEQQKWCGRAYDALVGDKTAGQIIAELEAKIEKLSDYAEHKESCGSTWFDCLAEKQLECDCGLRELLEGEEK